MVTVTKVLKKSYAQKAGIVSGDIISEINGNPINDVLDYRYYITEKRVEIKYVRDGEIKIASVSKDEYDDIGLEFETYLMDKKKSCKNKCIFCFIDQNPPGMRESIYFKDDDERLSFLQGNYVTLTNMTDGDIERIIKMHIMPIYVSVHTTDKELRCKMTGNRFAGEKLKYLDILSENGIDLNLQFVVCRGINDGETLRKSLNDCTKLKTLVSAAIVPSGLTAHREGLYKLEPFDKETASAVIDIVESVNAEEKKKGNEGKFFCSDEFYLIAERELPDFDYYEGFPQYENGVGMLRDLEESFEYALSKTDKVKPGTVHIATGKAAYDFIFKLARSFENKFPEKKIIVHMIKNEFYGETVTVSGLITGGDYIKQLKGKVDGVLLISGTSLNSEGTLFLDGITPEELEKELGVKLITTTADDLCFAIAEN